MFHYSWLSVLATPDSMTSWRQAFQMTPSNHCHKVTCESLTSFKPRMCFCRRHFSICWIFCFTRNARKEYIVAKYAERRYVIRREDADPGRLYDAVRSRDLTSLLQLYAEGADLVKPPTQPDGQVKIIYSHEWIFTLTFLSSIYPVRVAI